MHGKATTDAGGATTRDKRPLRLLVLGVHVEIACRLPSVRDVLVVNFGQMLEPAAGRPAQLRYHVISGPARSLSLVTEAGPRYEAENVSDLVYLLEKEIIVEVQMRRADLLFLHAAAIECRGRAWLIAGESGAGKSTTTWALLQHDCGYLSDELSPIDLDALQVSPYPHALCLKQAPPASYPLARGAMRLETTIHVPARLLLGAREPRATVLAGLFVLEAVPHHVVPGARRLTSAEAAARVYPMVLNALAHANHGVDAVLRVVGNLPCFALAPGELKAKCDRMLEIMRLNAQGDAIARS
jgi:hypothetical protein